jgi:hypothetical protein
VGFGRLYAVLIQKGLFINSNTKGIYNAYSSA